MGNDSSGSAPQITGFDTSDESLEPQFKAIPSWEELCQESFSSQVETKFAEGVKKLRAKPRKLLFGFGRAVTYLALRDPSYRKFLDSSWEEVIDIIYTQVADNRGIQNKHSTDELKPVCHGSLTKVQRRFQQQPCSRLTAMRRVEYAQQIADKSAGILLIGDDDLVGVELARAGFTNITVIDIDQGVLDQLAHIGSQEGYNFKLQRHDIRQQPPEFITKGDYQLVYLDPYYSLEGVETFLGAAMAMTANSRAPYFFLSVHLLSLMKSGLSGLTPLFREFGLELYDFRRSFNFYPIPQKTRSLISLVNRTVTKSKDLVAKDFRFFLSDAIVLRRSSER